MESDLAQCRESVNNVSAVLCSIMTCVLMPCQIKSCRAQRDTCMRVSFTFAEQMQSRATCKMECAHQCHVNMSCAQEFHHRRDLQGAGQGSCTSVANLILVEDQLGDCAIILVILHFVKPARKSRHHCPLGCFSSAAPPGDDRYTRSPRTVFLSQLRFPDVHR